jgi:hypothetical protein
MKTIGAFDPGAGQTLRSDWGAAIRAGKSRWAHNYLLEIVQKSSKKAFGSEHFLMPAFNYTPGSKEHIIP